MGLIKVDLHRPDYQSRRVAKKLISQSHSVQFDALSSHCYSYTIEPNFRGVTVNLPHKELNIVHAEMNM